MWTPRLCKHREKKKNTEGERREVMECIVHGWHEVREESGAEKCGEYRYLLIRTAVTVILLQ